MKKSVLLLISIITILFLSGCVSTAQLYDLPETYPTEFEPWEDEVDYVMFHQEINPSAYSKLVVLPINQSDVTFDSVDDVDDEEEDNEDDEIAIAYLEEIDNLYFENLSTLTELMEMPLVQTDTVPEETDVILLETDVLLVNPGSRGLRYTVGFGAGAAQLELVGRLVDGETGEILVTFRHKTYGMGGSFGGDSYELLVESMKDLAIEGFGSLIYSTLSK